MADNPRSMSSFRSPRPTAGHDTGAAASIPLAGSQPPTDAAEQPEEHTRNYTAVRGARERVQSVEFALLPGKGAWPSLEYAFLKETWWSPGDQEQEIVLAYTTGVKVTVTGWGLRRMYELLRQHRVTAVREDGDDPVKEKAARLEKAESWIYSIVVEKPEEERPEN